MFDGHQFVPIWTECFCFVPPFSPMLHCLVSKLGNRRTECKQNRLKLFFSLFGDISPLDLFNRGMYLYCDGDTLDDWKGVVQFFISIQV